MWEVARCYDEEVGRALARLVGCSWRVLTRLLCRNASALPRLTFNITLVAKLEELSAYNRASTLVDPVRSSTASVDSQLVHPRTLVASVVLAIEDECAKLSQLQLHHDTCRPLAKEKNFCGQVLPGERERAREAMKSLQTAIQT